MCSLWEPSHCVALAGMVCFELTEIFLSPPPECPAPSFISMNTLHIHFHCHPLIYLSLKLNIFITFICCVCILHRVQGTACESLFSLTMCIPRISLSNLYPVSHLTGLSTFLVCGLVIRIFSEVEKIMYFLWTWNCVLSGHRILKEGVVFINKVIKRDSWEAKLRPGNWSMSMRKLRLLRDLVYYIGRGNYRHFDQKEMFLDL